VLSAVSVVSPGQADHEGGCWSSTVTEKLQELVLLPESTATKVLMVMPMGNVEPEGSPAVCEAEAPAQLSLTVGGLYVTTASH
jgi:hypothetical protein